MQPIKTTNAMNPAPAKGIQSLPTPVIDDVIITETVNAWKGDYQKLEYGTMWNSVSHGSQQGSFPEHKLVFQQVSSEDGQWVKRIWANDRVNQDSYNYAIKYSAGSQTHPIYTRTYVSPRNTYFPLPDLTPDEMFPNALLVDEVVARSENELDSEYVVVTRVYETLPGPEVPTKKYNERGDLESVIVQTVLPGTSPDPDGLLITGSQVAQEDIGKGVKTTSSVDSYSTLRIKEKKEGLLGETVTTDDIVDPLTNPDQLSQTIVSSVVEQFTATKARKRTTTSTGPSTLLQKSKDGKLLGDVISTESIVDAYASPDEVSNEILSSEVRQIDSGKAVKKNIFINSTPTLSGNQNEQGLLGIKSTTESIVATGTPADALSLSVISSAVEPIDSVRSKKVTVTSSSPLSLLGGQKKEGLLGETNINESIVVSGTAPDTLSEAVVSSIVTPIDSAKSKKTTITSIGPTSLSQKSKDGKLLGDITSTETIVGPNSTPDFPSETIISSEIKQVDSGKAIKTNIVLNSTPTLLGGQSLEGLLGNKETNETIVLSGTQPDQVSLTVISSQVEPIDSVRSKKVTVTSTGPTTLSGGQKKDGLLGETNVIEQIVAAGTDPDALSQTIVSSVVSSIDSAKSKKTTITSIGPTSLSVKSLADTVVGQVSADVIKSIVDTSQLPEGGKFVLQDEISAIDSAKSQRERITVNSYPELKTYDLDEQLGVVIITERKVVDHNTPYSAPSLVLTSSDKPLDQWKTLRITSRLSNLPQQRTEYKTQQFTFPALLDSVTIGNYDLGFGRVPINDEDTQYATGINKFISIKPKIRPALSLPARIKIITTFYSSPPNPDNPYQISTQNVSYNGSLFGFNFGDVLLDGLTIGPIVANTFDQRYSGLSEGITFSASIPTKTQYNALIGTEVVIFSDVEYYKSNIWFKRTGYITLI